MTNQTKTFTQQTTAHRAGAPPSAAAPVLITEQQVLFGSAAALPLPLPHRPVSHRLADWARGLFPVRERPVRRHYPARYSFLENALMGREMDRL